MTVAVATGVWLFAYASVVIAAVHRRLRSGAQWRRLLDDCVYEVPAVHCALHLWTHVITCALLFGALAALWSDDLESRTLLGSMIPAWVAVLLLPVPTCAASLWLLRWRASHANAPRIDLRNAKVYRDIPRPMFETVGHEGFPNPTAPDYADGLRLRRAALGGGIAALLFVGAIFVQPWFPPSLAARADALQLWLQSMLGVVDVVPQGLLLAGFVSTSILLAITTVGDRQYLMMGVKRYCTVQMTLTAVATLCAGGLAAAAKAPTVAAAVFSGCVAAGMVRYWRDLRRSRRQDAIAKKRRTMSRPFAAMVEDLRRIARSKPLAALSAPEVSERIDVALRSLGEYSRWVPRYLARVLRVTEVATTQCAAAVWRFLLVSRRVELCNPRPSDGPAVHPTVDVWDTEKYPLEKPAGYVAPPLHRLSLPADFDVVESCSRCHGTGSVSETRTVLETESYTDTDGRSQTQTVTRTEWVTVTCGDCRGSGLLRYTQVIVTRWTTWQPVLQASENVSDLTALDDAFELTLLRRPFIESFEPVSPRDTVDRRAEEYTDVMQAMADVATSSEAHHAALAEDRFDARIYRSDFAVVAFHAIRAAYTGAANGTAWLFGAPPRSHFRRVPVSWSTLIAAAVLPPLAVVMFLRVRTFADWLIWQIVA